MRVTTRLYLAALPSVIGVLAVAGLAYWGQYAHAVPEIILAVAIAATVVTFVMSWTNVRYVALRVERLARNGRTPNRSRTSRQTVAGPMASSNNLDELDTIEGVVTQLSNAVQSAELGRERELTEHRERRREYAEILGSVAASVTRKLDDVRLPLHILLENHFGELNENQEEMLGAARVSAEQIFDELSAMTDLAELELGQILLRKDRVFPADMLNAILPIIRSQAIAKGIELRVEIAPLIPAFHVDASRLQRALLLLLTDAVTAASDDAEMHLRLVIEGEGIVVEMSVVPEHESSTPVLFARRIVEATGGQVLQSNGVLTIRVRQ